MMPYNGSSVQMGRRRNEAVNGRRTAAANGCRTAEREYDERYTKQSTAMCMRHEEERNGATSG